MKTFIDEREHLTIITLELTKTAIKPTELKSIEYPSVNPKKGVIINGRCPIWLYAAYLHNYHYCSFTGVNDPRLGAVITATHNPDYAVGDILPIFE